MTEDQLRKEFGKIKMSVSTHVQAKRVEQCVEIAKKYAEPEWIPIINGDLSGMPNGTIWITAKDIYGELFVKEVGGYWVKTISEIPVLAWMPYTEPTPYQS